MNLDRFLSSIGLSHDEEVRALLEFGRETYRGDHPLGWSPYQCVVDYASWMYPERLLAVLKDQPSDSAFVIFITPAILARLAVGLEELLYARL